MFLTNPELRTLSGYSQPRKQCGWLADQGIPFLIAGDGRPRVARRAVERMLIGTESVIKQPATPNEIGLERWQRGQTPQA